MNLTDLAKQIKPFVQRWIDGQTHGATQVGQVLFSVDGVSVGMELPLTGEAGWLIEENSGMLLVVDTP